jgi:hypothetical protein
MNGFKEREIEFLGPFDRLHTDRSDDIIVGSNFLPTPVNGSRIVLDMLLVLYPV